MPILTEEALICAVAIAAGFCLLNLLLISRSLGRRLHKMREDQLQLLYQPLTAVLLEQKDVFTEAQLAALSAVMRSNLALAPLPLLDAWNELERSFSSDDYLNFREILSSNYNHSKKLLGYPYDRDEILKEHLQSRKNHMGLYFLVIVTLVLMAAALVVMVLGSTVSSWSALGCCCGSILLSVLLYLLWGKSC